MAQERCSISVQKPILDLKTLDSSLNPNRLLEACADFVYCWAHCLPYSWTRSGLRQENKTDKMPTSKRKMNRKRWKQPKIIGKRSNDRLGLKYANCRNAVVGEKLWISHCLWDVLVRFESPYRFTKINPVWILLVFSPTNTPVNSQTCQLANYPICLIFSTKFNTKTAVFVNQSLARPKKSILAEVCFGAKRG